MNGRSTMEYLQHGAAGILTYGLVRGQEDVIAFGTVGANRTKTRLGSIALQEESIGYEFLVLSMDSTSEFRAKDRNGDWNTAEDWSNGKNVPIFKQYH